MEEDKGPTLFEAIAFLVAYSRIPKPAVKIEILKDGDPRRGTSATITDDESYHCHGREHVFRVLQRICRCREKARVVFGDPYSATDEDAQRIWDKQRKS